MEVLHASSIASAGAEPHPRVRANPASVARRAAAFVVDLIILVALASVVTVIAGERTTDLVVIDGQMYTTVSKTLSQQQARGVLLTWFAYLIVAEAIFGATIGKRLAGISVVQDSWTRLTLRGAVLRHLTHAVPVVVLASQGLGLAVGQIVVYVAGAVFALTSEDRQRLGDRLAGTIVVRRSGRAPENRTREIEQP
jgi:uncharacterized RDD family membrane protein YckC